MHSLKSGLATGYEGTTIFGRYYKLDELIALYLQKVRERVEAETGQAVQGVVLGRPVNFVESRGESDNQRAQDCLRRAAQEAGFREVAFELEPVAAALFYELTLDAPQNVLVFDLGGGTLDITAMRLGEPGKREVLSTGGVDVAGGTFDKRVIQWRLLDHFGRGSTVRLGAHGKARGEDAMPFPSQYTDALLDWQAVPELNKPETLHFLRLAQLTSSHPKQIRALESLVVNNYAMRLYDEVERAKIALSSEHFATIQLSGEDGNCDNCIDVWQGIARSQFEAIIAAETRRIRACLLDTLACSGLAVEDVDAVVRTGGSAQIPCFIEMLGRIFDPDKVVLTEIFSGVTAGLAIRAGMDEG